jgi:hypothetical protein
MSNPWSKLPATAPFDLDGDIKEILSFTKTASPQTWIDLELLPEPYIGRLDSPILILLTNPGWSPWDKLIYATPYARNLYDADV